MTFIPLTNHNKVILNTKGNIISAKKQNDINFTNKPNFKKGQANYGRVQEERKTNIELTRNLSQVLAIIRSIEAIKYHNMTYKQNHLYHFLTNKLFKQMMYGSRGSLHNDNNFLKLQANSKKKHSLSIKKREAESKNIETSNKLLVEATLKSRNLTSINISEYDLTTVQTETHVNEDNVISLIAIIHGVLNFSQKGIWFVSDEGSDENNCQTVSTP